MSINDCYRYPHYYNYGNAIGVHCRSSMHVLLISYRHNTLVINYNIIGNVDMHLYPTTTL